MRSASKVSGFTLLELMLALVILGIVVYKGVMVMSNAVESSAAETSEIVVEENARRVLHRIAEAVMSSDRDSLNPTQPMPSSSSDVQYRVNMGIHEGEVVWSDPEEIGMEDTDFQVYWSRNPETLEEMRIVWTSLVAPYLEGEIPNGMDDNGNGLIDEKGLSFVVDRNAITIRLTLERLVNGRTITRTVDTTVTCRNLPEPES